RLMIFTLAAQLLFGIGCKQPMDPVVESVTETNKVLREYTWVLQDYTVTVKNPDIPPPMLINVSDSMIKAGHYNLDDMNPGDSNFPVYQMQFTSDNKILADSSGVFVSLGGKYFVFNGLNIRLKPHKVEKLIYDYYYNPDDKTMSFTLTEEQASKAIDNATQNLIDDIINERPDKIGEAISDILHNSPKIQNAIKKMIKHAIAGKLPKIFDFDLEHNADTMAQMIRSHALDSINWKHILEEAIKHELHKIHNLHDSLGPAMTDKIHTEVATQLTVDRLHQAILPYLGGLDHQDPEEMAHFIATVIVEILGDIFSEENLQKIIEPIWRAFTKLGPLEIDEIAKKFTKITQDHWLNVDTLTAVFLPSTELIDETPISGLKALAQDATDSLEVFIDDLNAHFDSLNLDPDYDHIDSEIHAILLAAKPVIGTVGPEKVAQDIAQMLLDDIFTTDNIQDAFVDVLDYLQTISPETAAETIAQWLVNIEHKVGPELIAWLTEKLSPILNNINQGLTAYRIGNKVHNFVQVDFSAEGLQPVIFPMLQDLRNMNGKSLAEHIAKALIKNKITKEEADEDIVANVILQALMNHGDNPDDPVSVQMVKALSDHDLLRSGKTPDLLAKVISFILYAEAWHNFKIANNFQEATIIISHDIYN
ncbi:MAG: hypothetical protein J7L04_05065, partial [Bacteroidales bacterium]|nr:hypothetical protein [Bacteroidales bacterium]